MTDRHPLLKFLVFALVCLAFAAWLIITIGNISLFADRTSYTARFTDVQGLLVNDDVKVSGVTVGKVTGIEVIDGTHAKVDFEVRDDVRLGDETTVQIRWRDVIGLRFLYVRPAGSGALEPGTQIPDERTIEPADIGVLLQRLTPVMRALDPEKGNQVVEAFAEALVGREERVRSLIAEGASLTQALASREDEIASLLTNAATVVDAYAAREDQLRGFIESFAEVADTIAARNDTLEGAVVALGENQEELARLLEANDGELRGALDALEAITEVLSANHENLEVLAAFTGRGLVAYHRISSLGQWFNIRAVGFSSGEERISSEREGDLPSGDYPRQEEHNFIDRSRERGRQDGTAGSEPDPAPHTGGSSALSRFFVSGGST